MINLLNSFRLYGKNNFNFNIQVSILQEGGERRRRICHCLRQLYNCSGWFHGSCAGLSKDDVAAMGRISGCLWICTSCRNDDVFQSEAKLTSLSATKEIKISVNSIQNSLIEIKKSVLEPLKVATKAPPSGDSTTFREILISRLVEQKGDFHSSFEADDSKLQEVFQHIGEPTLSIEATRRLGRPQRDSNRPRPLLIRFTSEWDARKCLSKGYKLKNLQCASLHIEIAQ